MGRFEGQPLTVPIAWCLDPDSRNILFQFWQSFFEASANVQLSGYDDELESASNLSKSVAEDSTELDSAQEHPLQGTFPPVGHMQAALPDLSIIDNKPKPLVRT